MILAAGLLVLLGLGLFVAGIVTGATVLYWACVAACVVAAGLLVAVRRQTARTTEPGSTAARAAAPGTPTTTGTPTARRTGSRSEAAATESAPGRDVAGEATAGPDAPAAGKASATAASSAAAAADARAVEEVPDPDVEEVEVTDLLVVMDLTDEVLVVDEHPRYHLAECAWLAGRETIPLPLDEARTDGFTPCAVCAPDRNLAQRARTRKGSGAGQPEV